MARNTPIIIRRRDYGTMNRPLGHGPCARAELGWDDEGCRVVHSESQGTYHPEPAPCRWVRGVK